MAIPLFEIHGVGFFPYVVAPDGRFLINTLGDGNGGAAPVSVILNWTAALKP